MSSIHFQLQPADNARLSNLCGQFDEHLRQIEQRLEVQIKNRGGQFSIEGEDAERAHDVLTSLYEAADSEQLSPQRVHLALQESGAREAAGDSAGSAPINEVRIRTRKEQVRCRGTHQIQYVESIRARDLSFGIGPAGTGKTYLAVACAVEALEAEQVQRLVLVRPAVEAGERLGFLPGDLAQKVDPYLRPIYDALYDFLGFERVGKLIERNVIEIAPLAYMRGRTLNHAFIIMDEAQNTTVEQMKMFLTRIGFGSTAVVTGDITQCDLPKRTLSGLRHVQQVLSGIDAIGFTHFDARDVVRHQLVQRIVSAYEAAEQIEAAAEAQRRAERRDDSRDSRD
jgi:phosphate starvation-inducible PhoH-like protein